MIQILTLQSRANFTGGFTAAAVTFLFLIQYTKYALSGVQWVKCSFYLSCDAFFIVSVVSVQILPFNLFSLPLTLDIVSAPLLLKMRCTAFCWNFRKRCDSLICFSVLEVQINCFQFFYKYGSLDPIMKLRLIFPP